MQIKEYEAFTLKECLQQVRADLGPEAVILETRKIRKGGVLGLGARDAVCLVAAIGINVKDDVVAARRAAAPAPATASTSAAKTAPAAQRSPAAAVRAPRPASIEDEPQPLSAALSGRQRAAAAVAQNPPRSRRNNDWDIAEEPQSAATRPPAVTAGQSAAIAAARNAYARAAPAAPPRKETAPPPAAYDTPRQSERAHTSRANGNGLAGYHAFRDEQDGEESAAQSDAAFRPDNGRANHGRETTRQAERPADPPPKRHKAAAVPPLEMVEDRRFALLEKAMHEIREGLSSLQREQQESHERTVSAVVSAVAPTLSASNSAAHFATLMDTNISRFPELHARLTDGGVSSSLAHELLDALPDFDAWSEEAQTPLAASALRDLIARRIGCSGPIQLTPGTLKAVALIGPTGVGKTTTIAKLAAHFALVEKKRVALLTMDTYRIAAVEQLKIYSQILDIPVGVAYSQAEVAPVVAQYADYDLLLIDTAGRSQKNIMQVGELKFLLETVGCETHLVLSAQTKERDMIEAAQRFAAARVDSIIFSKLDETDSYGTLLNVADRTGIPLSYLTMGQKVPEDLEPADGGKLASLLVD